MPHLDFVGIYANSGFYRHICNMFALKGYFTVQVHVSTNEKQLLSFGGKLSPESTACTACLYSVDQRWSEGKVAVVLVK